MPGRKTFIDTLQTNLAGLPAAADNAGRLVLLTDVAGGTPYRSDGSTWTQAAAGVNSLLNLFTTKGDLLVATSGSTYARLGVGANGTFLQAQSGQGGGMLWATHDSTGDPHTQLALLAGRSGGQTLKGGTASGEDLVLESTSDATKGTLFLNDAVELRGADATFTASPAFLFTDNAYTLDFASAALTVLKFASTVEYSQTGSASNAFSLVLNSGVVKNVNAEANNFGFVGLFNNIGTIQCDGVAGGITLTTYAALNDAPTFDVVNSGVLTISGVNSVRSLCVVNTGATVTTRRGLNFADASGTGALGTQVAVDIAALAKATTNIGIRNASTTVNTPSTAQTITAVTQAITVASTVKKIDANASYTLTAAPTIADGVDGQVVTIINTDSTDVITIQDQGTLASSNLRLGATTRAIGPRDSITLMYSSTVGDWVELYFSNVI